MKKLFTILATLILYAQSWAGVSTSGGGFAVVCRGANQKIHSAEVLDLVEGRIRYKLNIFQASGSELKDYTRAVENAYWLQMNKPCNFKGCLLPSDNFQRFINIVDWVNDRSQLDMVYDLGNVSDILKTMKRGCNIEQVAVYLDQADRVKISKEAWLHLDSLSKAALVQHELMYRHSRRYVLLPELDSESSRLATAITFASQLPTVHDGVPKGEKPTMVFHDINNHVTGKYDSTTYYSFQVNKEQDYLKRIFRKQFTQIAGRPVLTQTYVEIPGGVNFGDRFPLKGAQFKGWYLLVIPARSLDNSTGLTLRLMNPKNLAVMDLQ